MKDILVYLPKSQMLVSISEGSGDNLTMEDIKEGFADYLNYSLYRFRSGEIEEDDGGMILLEKLCADLYPEGKEKDAVEEILKFHFGETPMEYQILS